METTYIVSGYMRTGTSMMMKALEAGGLETAFNPVRDKMNEQHGDDDYKPNVGGFYELHRTEYRQDGFPRMYQGKLLKCLWGGLQKFVVGNYKVVFMMRDPEEIRQSFEAFFNGQAPPTLEKYNEIMKDTIDMLKNRKDTQLTILKYRDVINNPRKEFQKLRDVGWEIDIDKCVSIVKPDLCRFKIENLTVGI